MNTYIHTYMHTYIQLEELRTMIAERDESLETYIYIHVHAYIYTYIHKYIHTARGAQGHDRRK